MPSRLTSAQETLLNLPEIDERNVVRIAENITEAIENLQSEASHSGGNQRLDGLHDEIRGIDEPEPDQVQSIADEAWQISKRMRGTGFDYDMLRN
ncbi:hypothetical protein ACFR9U_16040 [Halorientalis brevis]|uniref:Uncharacterized protein n=1 Tax=Halorientalis brevis TaxID=1126241 RepID=A0ABD6CFV8_9EURY|nr:hypothetical protein [Halorientalis brevis]